MRYFDCLQVAIGNQKSLTGNISDTDWYRIFEFCKRQALIGIGFSAVERLHHQGIECPASLKIKWMALAIQIERQNEKLNNQCKVLMEHLEHDGLHCCILKGQSNLLNYPKQLKWRRNPGDIDVWCIAPAEGMPIAVQTGENNVEYDIHYGRRAIIEYVQMLNRNTDGKEKRALFHHIEAPKFNGIDIEIHYRPSFCHSPLRNVRLQRWFREQADICMKNKNYLGFASLTSSVNVIYQMCHMFSHLFETGLGLRQFLDYYFALKAWHNDVMECKDLQSQGMWSEGLGTPVMSKVEVMAVLRSFGMAKFAAAVMYVLHKVFAMPTYYYICEPNEKEGHKLLYEIMRGGNFGQYDKRGKDMRNGGSIPHAIWKLKRVMRLVSSYPEEALCEPFFRVWHWGWRLSH